MSNKSWCDRWFTIHLPRRQPRRTSRRRFVPHRVELGITDTLEPRIVLSAINGSHDPAATGVGSTNPTATTNGFNTDDEFDWADEPVMVTGSFLTSVGVTDTRNMSFDDIEQGYSDTCVFSSVLAAAALTTFSLESGITVRSAVGGMTIYDVRMYDKTASGSFVAISQSVAFDGTVQPEDLRPADSNEYWTTIYLRAYLDFAESRGAEYRTYEFAMESLFGAGYEETNVQEAGASLALAKQIQSALAAGRATVAGTEDSASDLIDSTYGLASNHAYTIMGIEIPASGNLSQTYVTVRNPWAVDTSPYFFDANHDKDLDSKEYSAYVRGIDGSNDGLIRLPWNVFSTNFEDVASTTRTGPGINRPLGPPVIFSPASIGPFTIGEGEHLVVPLKATESSGKFVLYEGFGTRGNIHVQNGTYDWYPPIGSVGKHVIKIRASTGPFNVADISFEVNVVSGAPTVGALQSSPSSIRDDGSDRLTLTAKNVVASVGSVSRVEFWLDKNGNNRIDSSEDVMMGIGTRQGADSVWTGYVGLEAGFRVFLTRAVRYSQIADHYSNTKSTSVTVTKAVPLPSVAVPRGDQSRLTPLNVPDEIAFRSLQDAAGHYRVLVGQSGTSFSFYVRHLDGNGNLLETDSVAETNAAAVDMFVKADGSFAVVWLSRASSGGSINIKLRWYNSSGTAIGGIVDLATVPDTVHPYVQIAGDSLGDLLVAYNVGNYFEEDIWALSVSRAGTLTREPWRVNSYTTGMQKNPTVSMNSSGDGVIAWSDADQQRIMARRFSQTGTRATEIFEAGIFEESDILIDSAIRENGEFCITWQNKWSNSDKVFVQRFSSSGTKQGSTITANKFPGGGLYKSKVSLNNAGWMVVAWTSNLQSTNCYAQVFAPNGEKQGPEFSVPSKPDESGQIVDVNLDDHGNLLFVFREVGDRFGENSVQSRLFEINLTPVITPDQSFSIAENLPAQSVVGIIRAEDPNLRTQLSWELIGAPEFSIDPQSGMLTTNVVLDRETKSSYQLTIRVTDGKLAAQGTVTVNVIESNDAPTVSSSGLVLTYTEQSPAALIADDEFVQDVDSASFSGGYLSAIVTPVAGSELQQAADRISIGNTRGVTIAAGNKVIINGIEVGLLSGSGIGVNPFRIDLNENATLTATTILLQSLQFDCAGDNPLAGRRNISITVNDGQGGISLPSIAAVDVAAINDAPGISGFDTSILYGRNTGPVTLDADTIVTDPDSVDFSTGSLTVAISSNAQNTDRIGIRNTGTAAGQIGVSGTAVSYGGVAIGTFTGTTTLVVTLNASATPAGCSGSAAKYHVFLCVRESVGARSYCEDHADRW
jgi:hypothetical protein